MTAARESAAGVAPPDGAEVNSKHVGEDSALDPAITQTLEPLTREDSNALRLYEIQIDTGFQAVSNVGKAFGFIRDGRLYRATHSNFEAYCLERWNLRRNYVDKLIAAAPVFANLSTTVRTPPDREGQVRALVSLPADQQFQVWNDATEAAERREGEHAKPTANDVREAVQRHQQRAEEPVDDGNADDATVIEGDASALPVGGTALRPEHRSPAVPEKPKPTIGLNQAVSALKHAVERDRDSALAALATLREVASRGLYGPKTTDAPAAFRELVEVVGLLIGGVQ